MYIFKGREDNYPLLICFLAVGLNEMIKKNRRVWTHVKLPHSVKAAELRGLVFCRTGPGASPAGCATRPGGGLGHPTAQLAPPAPGTLSLPNASRAITET